MTPKSDFIDFTPSNERRFYSSNGDPLRVKGWLNQFLAERFELIFNGIKDAKTFAVMSVAVVTKQHFGKCVNFSNRKE